MITLIGHISTALRGALRMGKALRACFLLSNGAGTGVTAWNGAGPSERHVAITVPGPRIAVFVGCGETKGSVGNSVVSKWRR
ncbi:hypothetical protein AAER19_29920, partial [Pseudomonas aeruginosa]